MLALILQYKYLLLVPVAIIEGPFVTMASGFLVRTGVLSVVPTYFCLMAGDLIGDLGWYAIGYWAGHPFVKKFGKYFSVTEKTVKTVSDVFHKHTRPIIFVSKITMGFGFALGTLITAGIVKIPLKYFALFNFLGQIIWTAMLMGIGYLFGHLYTTVNDVFWKVSIVALFIFVFLCILGIGRYVKSQVLKKNI